MPATVQGTAPAFSTTALMPDKTFKTVSLSDYKGRYVVLFFYPLDFTFVCPTEITQFSDRVEEFKALGCDVVGCSIDSQFSHLAWTEKGRKQGGLGEMKIPLLADVNHAVCKAYGVECGDGIALRGLFVIDPKQKVRHITINDLPVGRNVDEVLRTVSAFKHTDEHGDVMPCNWTPGKKTMQADPVKSQEYFKLAGKRAAGEAEGSAAKKVRK